MALLTLTNNLKYRKDSAHVVVHHSMTYDNVKWKAI